MAHCFLPQLVHSATSDILPGNTQYDPNPRFRHNLASARHCREPGAVLRSHSVQSIGSGAGCAAALPLVDTATPRPASRHGQTAPTITVGTTCQARSNTLQIRGHHHVRRHRGGENRSEPTLVWLPGGARPDCSRAGRPREAASRETEATVQIAPELAAPLTISG